MGLCSGISALLCLAWGVHDKLSRSSFTPDADLGIALYLAVLGFVLGGAFFVAAYRRERE